MDGQPYPTSNAQQLRAVQQLLWDVISLHLYPAERDEIRRALGGALLDENESLFAEAGALADILGDVQLNTGSLLTRHQLCSNPQRSMVESEIRLLVERLHASASVSPFGSAVVRERDPDALMPRSGRRDKAVLDYVNTVTQIAETGGRPPSAGLPPRPPSTAVSSSSRPGTSSRPPTALSASASMTSPHSRPGTASPTRPGSRPSTASSAASSAATRYTDAPSVVAGVADKLNVSNIDAVRETLRTALMDERAVLLEDVEYLQGLLEAEADLQARAAAPPPSLAELRDYSHRLAAVVAGEEARVEHEVRVSAMFEAADQQQNKAGRLRGMVDASRRPVSGGNGGGSAAAAAAAAPLEAVLRSSVSGISGGAQTLVVHSGGEEEDLLRQPQQRQPSSGPSVVAASTTTAHATAHGGGGGSGGSPHSRTAPLAAVRRPGSSGSTAAIVTADPASPLPPVLPPPAAAAALRPGVTLPATRLSHSPSGPSTGGLSSHADAALRPHSHSPPGPTNAASASCHTKPADSNGLSASPSSSASSSRPLHSPSPGRLRPVGPTAATGALPLPLPQSQTHTHTQQQSAQQPLQNHAAAAAAAGQPPQPHSQPHSYSDKSPSLRMRSPPGPTHAPSAAAPSIKSGCAAAAAAAAGAGAGAVSGGTSLAGSGLRPVLPRSGSVGRAAAGGGGGAAGFSSVTSSTGARTSGRMSSSAIAAEAMAGRASLPYNPAAAAAAGSNSTPGSAVAARLGGGGGGGTAAAGPTVAELYGTAAVQPRALMGNKHSVVERLDEEVDKVRGGVAAILERYNIRPSAPSSTAGGATSVTAAAVAAPPATSSQGA